MLNYWRSSEAERIALAPKPKWIVASTQIEGYEQSWANANQSNESTLYYNPQIEGGTLVPAPHREQPTPMDMAIVNAAREAVDAIKATTGIFDASLGAESNEKSGRAIIARERQGDTSNYHFFDNMAKSLRHTCRIIVDIIPEIYDTARTIRILGEDMKEKIVEVNKQYDAGGKVYNLKAGQYDVMVETGPSFMSKRQETATNLQQLAQNDPVIVQCARDLILKYMDLPSDVVERAQKTIPPQFMSDDKKKVDPNQLQAMVAQSQQQLQQLDQVIQAMTEENEQLQQKLNVKTEDNRVKLAIADLQAQVQLIINSAKISQEDKKLAHEVGMEAMSNAHQLMQGDVAHQQAIEQQSQQTQQQIPSQSLEME
jgi:hypothetical protein